MTFVRRQQGGPIKLQLARDLTRTIKRGNPWVFADSLRDLPPAKPGSPARLLDKRGKREIARGFYDPGSPLALRICSLEPNQTLNDYWARQRLTQAVELRRRLFGLETTAYRLFNGEGDGLPGLVCDLYADTAVIRLDGPASEQFWDAAGLADWLTENLPVQQVYQRKRVRSGLSGQTLIGDTPETITFLENDIQFTADVIRGQKTGFFLDQRENRQRVRQLAAGQRVLNVFGYTGGFSVYAGVGGAQEVTTVDLAEAAVTTADAHWRLNNLDPDQHHGIAADAFAFLAEAAKQHRCWDLVILDPPSFAPSKKARSKALAAYQNLTAAGAGVTEAQGFLAAASCSSHVDLPAFLQACEEGVSKARRRATVLTIGGQPPDHPAPLALPAFRYLKFVLMQLD